MDDIPVKISEKYKPPPKFQLPSSIQQRLNNPDSSQIIKQINYDFSLEKNVLVKMNEWRILRENNEQSRKERLRLRNDKKLKLFEEKQKRLLTNVSYPNAEDLSSQSSSSATSECGGDNDEDDNDLNGKLQSNVEPLQRDEEVEMSNGDSCDNNESLKNQQKSKQQQSTRPNFSPPNSFDTILKPIIVPGLILNNLDITKNTSSLTNINNSNENSQSSVTTQNKNLKNIKNNFNYSDFETDPTSDPFDNMELKTINDLDILAQVLNNSALIHQKTLNNVNIELDEQTVNVDTVKSKEINEIELHSNVITTIQPGTNLNDNTFYTNQNHLQSHHQQTTLQQQQQQQQVVQQSTQHQHIPQYYENYNYSMQQPQHHPQMQPIHQPQTYNLYQNHNTVKHSNYNYTELLNGYYYQQQQAPSPPTQTTNHQHYYNQPSVSYQPQQQTQQHNHHQHSAVQQTTTVNFLRKNCDLTAESSKIKSKSVPDIIKELNDELKDNEMKRTRNNSQSIASPVDGKINNLIFNNLFDRFY